MKVQTAVVFAAGLCAQSGFGQNRPIIPEVFQSRVSIEVTTQRQCLEGCGQGGLRGKASEVYAIRPGPRDEFDAQVPTWGRDLPQPSAQLRCHGRHRDDGP